MQHEGGDAARAPLQHRPPAMLLPRPAVSYSGLSRGGTADLQQLQEKERVFPPDIQRRHGAFTGSPAHRPALPDSSFHFHNLLRTTGNSHQHHCAVRCVSALSSSSSSIITRGKECLKLVFVIFSIFFMIVGGLIVIVCLAQLSPSLDDLHGNDVEVKTSHIVLYIVGSVTLVIAILGAYGAHKESLVALTVYLVCMVIGCLLMLQAGVPAAVAQSKLESVTEERWRSFLPLDQASDDVKNQAEALQTSLRCCGLFSPEDWEDNIPDSCLCNLEEEMEGECQTVRYSNFLLNFFRQKKSVFRQNCFPFIMDSVTTNANIMLGVYFTLLALALLGLVLCSLTIYQMFNTSSRPSTPLSVMFIDHPPAYQQLYNLTE